MAEFFLSILVMLFLLGIIGAAGSLYDAGKRNGSRKGYAAGKSIGSRKGYAAAKRRRF